jgi:glycosyltransferase involved in cell wall biosynthesis
MRSDTFAGVERYVASVAGALAARGHHVTVIGGDGTAMRAAVSNRSVTLIPAATTRNVAAGLARHARRADIIHVHMTAAESAALAVTPILRAPILATRHFAQRRGSSLAGKAVAPLIARMLVEELAISEFVAASVGTPVTVLLSGTPRSSAIDPSGRVVLVAQRLEREKNTHEVLDAWQRTGLVSAGWELMIAGDGSERKALEMHAARAGIDGVRFVGLRADVARLRASAGVFVAPAPAEPFGLSVVEAMAQGLPVIAAAGGGHLETVGRAAPELLYPPGDIPRFAKRLTELACDVGERRRLGTKLRHAQRQFFDLDRHVDRLVGIYRGHTPSNHLTALSS